MDDMAWETEGRWRAGVLAPEVLRIEGWRLTLPPVEETAPPIAAARSNEACDTPARGAVGWC